MEIETAVGTLELLVGSDDVDVGISAPTFLVDVKEAAASLPPRDTLTLVHRVPPVGTKFHAPKELVPVEPPAVRGRAAVVWLRAGG